MKQAALVVATGMVPSSFQRTLPSITHGVTQLSLKWPTLTGIALAGGCTRSIFTTDKLLELVEHGTVSVKVAIEELTRRYRMPIFGFLLPDFTLETGSEPLPVMTVRYQRLYELLVTPCPSLRLYIKRDLSVLEVVKPQR